MNKINIGLLVSVEIKSVLNKFGLSLKEEKVSSGFKVYLYEKENFNLIIIDSGIGEIAASAATQLLISEYKVKYVINFGVVGGLTPTLNSKSITIVDKIVHYDFDISKIDNLKINQYPGYNDIYFSTDRKLFNLAKKKHPELIPVICASGDKFIDSPQDKSNLHNKYNADICEMESAGIILTANKSKVPTLFIKIISDALNEGHDSYYNIKDEASSICLNVVDSIMEELK